MSNRVLEAIVFMVTTNKSNRLMRLTNTIRGLIALVLVMSFLFPCLSPITAFAQPAWPTDWISVGTDPDEGGGDNFRDVLEAYYQADSAYLYLRLRTVEPAAIKTANKYGRYKWFFDTNNDMTLPGSSGGTVYNWEYLFYVEDTNGDNFGEIYLGTPSNPAGVLITNTNIAGYRLNSGGNYADLYIRLDQINNLANYWVGWATDNRNPNYDQAPKLDSTDSTTAIHLVAKGTITVVKNVVGPPPGDNWQFNYTGTGGISGNFNIAAGGGQQILGNLPFGSYTITETTKSNYICSPGDTINVALSAAQPNRTITFTNTLVFAPTADFTASPTSGCAPLSLTFTDTSTGGPASWSWSFPGGNPSTATGQGPHSVTYNSAGSYDVSLTVTNAYGEDTETKTGYITVNPSPEATASSNSPVVEGATIELYGSPDGMSSYSWSGPGGFSSQLQNPTRPNATIDMSGTYTLSVTDANGCYDDASVDVIVAEASTVNAINIYDTQDCLGPPVTSMDPLVTYYARVTVDAKSKLKQISEVRVTLFYNPSGDPAMVAPTTPNTQTCAILTWTASPEGWGISAGSPTTWQIITGECVRPANLEATSGDWIFAFVPGKVAAENRVPATWDIQGWTRGPGQQTSELYVRNKNMNWYGEITVPSSVDWGEVPLGLTFEDTTYNPQTLSINYIANGDYFEDIRSSGAWSGSDETVTLDVSGDNPPPAGMFALKTDNTSNLNDALVVTTLYKHINASGSITGEDGVTVNTNSLWLSLGETDIAPVVYSGDLYFQIAPR